MSDEEPKIFIDEDWKSQVDREREEALQQQETPEPKDSPDEQGEAPDDTSLFEVMFSGMAAQAMMALGLMAEEGQKEVMVDLGLAKHLIDTMAMLQEKTKGNLTEREEASLGQAVSELQRAFSVRAQQAQESALRQQGVDPSNIEGLPPR